MAAESQAERLKKELRFLKESYEAGIISEDEFKKGKDRIEKRLAEWGEGVVEQYNVKKEEPAKQDSLETYGKNKKQAAKKIEKKTEEQEEEADEEEFEDEEKEYFGEDEKTTSGSGTFWKITTFVLLIAVLVLMYKFYYLDNTIPAADIKSDLIILNDKNCGSCDTKSAENVMEKLFPELSKEYVDYSTDLGKKLYSNLGIEFLPAYIVKSTKLESTKTWNDNMNIRSSFRFNNGYYVLLPSQTDSSWKPN